ncbi:MAG: YidC/Oxa1 family membrane protein insertase [Patescibacteria group bacterium]
MMAIYYTILYQPLFNLLIWLYNVLPGDSIGLAIVVLTVLIRLILYPFTAQSFKAQHSMQSLQPKLDAIKREHKDNKEKQSLAMMQLYKTEKINPLSSCLPMLIQLPFLIAVYQVFRQGLANGSFDLLYSFVASPERIDTWFWGMDLGQPQVILAVLAAGAQFWQGWMMKMLRPSPDPATGGKIAGSKDEDMAAMMTKQMMYVMPVMTLFIGLKLPGGLALYWCLTTLLMVAQQWWYFRKKTPPITSS